MASLKIPIQDVFANGISITKYVKFEATLACKDTGATIAVKKALTLEYTRDYSKSYGDEIIMEAYFQLGDYLEFIQKSKGDLTMYVKEDRNSFINTEVYRAIVLNDDVNPKNAAFNKGVFSEMNKEIAFIRFQLVERSCLAMMQMFRSGVVAGQDLHTYLTCMMGEQYLGINFPNDRYTKSLSFVPFHNKRSFRYLKIPANIKTLDLPSFFQWTDHGIYNGDTNTYIQPFEVLDPKGKMISRHRPLCLYPTISAYRDERVGARLKLYLTPNRISKDIERTYRIGDNNNIHIVVSSDDNITEVIDAWKISKGDIDIYRSTEAEVQRKHGISGENITVQPPLYVRDDHVSVKESIRVPMDYKHNAFNFSHDRMIQAGFVITIKWKFSVPNILFPGQLVEFFYEELVDGSTQVKQVYGVLQKTYTQISNDNRMSNTIMFIFLTKVENY